MAYFPMYVSIEGKRALVVGGGEVALRKASVLLDFGACPVVVAAELLPQLRELSGVHCVQREFEEKDLADCVLVVAATNDPQKNHAVAELAKARGIPVNAVDQPGDCSFIFPSYIKRNNLVGAFSSGGKSPAMAKHLRRELAGILTEKLGEQNEYLGSIRERVRAEVEPERRALVYEQILAELLASGATALDGERLGEIEKAGQGSAGR
ncbi:MAG: bifunctional precorrin-2 dehydrogenase/sirohydrochlorin ferrochelatase [Muribaculaceae bacterium]|nr:bifunctional precorrin-2 dehydrogenase/sirohydrochlorin ferrochelatase [Roseburia sp.]MCM1430054.1 bifunctional precorrin-2 dehydrogenase/sirohydrochlorin ferrochelatase [Muribaculaceae bacterium]MCM1493873.1 bifunctional precorrin-2 dehydrogenase/sirohydrochlorin ferrochelatase [Muribaculaceae bacterium]